MLNGTDKGVAGENVRALKKQGLSEREAVLISMKNSPKKKDKSKEPISCCGPDSPSEAYPYGLRIDLRNESLDKLGLKKLPEVGETLKLAAEVRVDSVSERQDRDGTKNRNVDLQITKMKLG